MPKNLLSLSRTHVWQNPNQKIIFIIVAVYVVELALVMGSIMTKVHILQHTMR